MLDAIDIAGLDITADALLTQRELANYLVARGAHYHFTVKGNQPTLQRDIALLFEHRGSAQHTQTTPAEHGRIETRRIWCSDKLNDYVDFPHVGQVFLIQREVIHKKSARQSMELALGVTSRTPNRPTRLLCCASTGATGPSRTAATMSLIQPGTKIAAASAPAMDQKTPHACGDLPSA